MAAFLAPEQAKLSEAVEAETKKEFEKSFISDFGHVLWFAAARKTSVHRIRMEKLGTISKVSGENSMPVKP